MSKSKWNISGKGRRRFVTKTKWELPLRDSKLSRNVIHDEINSVVQIQVRNASSSIPISYTLPSTNHYSPASSVDFEDVSSCNFLKRHRAVVMLNPVDPCPSVKVASAFCRDFSVDNKSSSADVKSSPELIEDLDEKAKSQKGQNKFTKLSMITRLVNEFLSGTRTRVRPTSNRGKNVSSQTGTSSEIDHQRKLGLSKKFVDKRCEDASSERLASNIQKGTDQCEQKTGTIEDGVATKRSVGFVVDLEGRVDKDCDPGNDNTADTRPKRLRAPSLSIASALPSFARVVISIEDTDSVENEEAFDAPKEEFDCLNPTVHGDRVDSGRNTNDVQKQKQDFLKVPEVQSIENASYPPHVETIFQRQSSNVIKSAEGATETKERKESKMLGRQFSFWPKRSTMNVFHALKTMKRGLRSRARIESEMNKFFSAPLRVDLPSDRSSVSSDGDTSFLSPNVLESMSEQYGDDNRDEDENDRKGLRDRSDIESDSFSYTSVRERLMRNSVAHLSRDFQHPAMAATCIDINNSLKVTSYNSWTTNESKEKRRNKTSERHLIGIPRVGRIYPRIKSDKCLACMCQSLEIIDQSRQRRSAGTSYRYIDDSSLISNDDDEELYKIMEHDLSSGASFDQSFRIRHVSSPLIDKLPEKSTTEHYETGTLTPDAHQGFVQNDENLRNNENAGLVKPKSDVDASRNHSQMEDSYRSRSIGRLLSKPLISAKSLITALSIVSERSRSISDQDDSDQGCMDPASNATKLEAVSTSKYFAPCHMPINLKPSLEPLRALKTKKSRSIRSRVASAEKSGDSDSKDDDDSDFENIGKHLVTARNKLVNDGSSMRLQSARIPKDEGIGTKESDAFSGEENEVIRPETTIDCEKISSTDGPVISDREVIVIARKCFESHKTITEVLHILAEEYSRRLANRLTTQNGSNNTTQKNEKIASNLLTLLVDSMNYLNCRDHPNNSTNLLFSSKQPVLCTSRQLKRILPLKSYNLVAPILGIDITRRTSRMDRMEKSKEATFDLMVHPPSRLSQNVGFEKCSKNSRSKVNPYAMFLTKPKRKAVTWRPLTNRDLEGYDPEATLRMRAAKITDGICEDFCRWLESLAAGSNRTNSIDVDVLKDMFETDFTAEVCNTMQLSIRETPMVPIAVAIARNCPNSGELVLTRKHLINDARAEARPKRTIGFGTALDKHLKFVPPRNRVDEKWLQCRNVPKDIETMDAVWKGITHLASVKGFIKWLRNHPEVKRPSALEKALTSEKAMGTTQSTIDGFKHLELDLSQIHSLKVHDNASDAK